MRGLLKTYQQKQHHLKQEKEAPPTPSKLTQDPIFKKIGSQEDLLEKPKTKEELKLEKIKEKQRMQILRAAERRDHWVNMVANDPDFVTGFQQGALPLYHVDNLKFRDFSAPGRTGLIGSVPKSSVDHSLLNKIPKYDYTDYDDKSPNKLNNFRHRNQASETTMPILKYTHKDQNERIKDKLESQTKLNTEPLNTLLLVKPKWRENDESKWVSTKDFQSQNSRKDQAWLPFGNVSERFPEPFIENKVQFRQVATQGGPNTLQSQAQKRRNFSQTHSQAPGGTTQSANQLKKSPVRSIMGGGDYDESPVPIHKHEVVIFDSTIPHDKTWKNRAIQSTSLRQKHHLNLSLKMRKNLQMGSASGGNHQFFDIRAQMAMESKDHDSQQKSITKNPEQQQEGGNDQFEKEIKEIVEGKNPKISIQMISSERTEESEPAQKPLSPIIQESHRSPDKIKQPHQGNSQSQTKKPPLPKKEHVLSLSNVSPDRAANYINNDFQQSYTNSWQYNVVVKAPQTYFNKKFQEKEELREEHILWEVDHEKTYFRSAMEKINPQEIKNQMETDKLRRTNMILALNQNVMEKTTTEGGFHVTKGSFGFKKFGMSHKKPMIKEPNFLDERLDTAYNSSVISSTGPSPFKQMSMTMTRGFISPKNGLRKQSGEMNKTEIKAAVKNYFDKTSNFAFQGGYSNSPVAPTTAGGSMFLNDDYAFNHKNVSQFNNQTTPMKLRGE